MRFPSHPLMKAAAAAAVLCMLSMGLARPVRAEQMTVDMSALVHETQKASRDINDILLTWWIPEALWTLFLNRNPSMTPQDKQQFLKNLSPYTVFLAVDGRIGDNGVPTFQDRKFLMKTVHLIGKDKNRFQPLKEDQINAEAKQSLARVFPHFARSLGPMGPHLHFLVFPAVDAKGRPIATAFQEGFFALKTNRMTFYWRTPLGPLVPSKHSPDTGEELPGGWKYNPWTGVELK